ncbi:Prefoldin subunit 6 [Naganishia albida]|nr:Prefoldin subunit 6 [Naganishia albida]
MSKIEQDFQKASKEFQRLQAELTATIEARQKLDYQQSESDLVLKELKKLRPENTVYKLIGPGLMPQDSGEAQQTVEKRLDFIEKEIERIETQLKTIGEKAEKKKTEIIKLQTEIQKSQPQPKVAQ